MGRILMAILTVFMMFGLAFAQQATPAKKQILAQPQFSVKGLRLPVPQQQAPEVFTPQGRILNPEAKERLQVQADQAFDTFTLFPNVCYTMNSFQFKREDGGDATRLVKQTTCTPGRQFRVKKATVTTTR
jgi:hypothetical protein